MDINVRDYLPTIEEQERIFVRERKLDKKAAAYRYSVVEEHTDALFNEINSERADVRDIPSELADLYEQMYKNLVEISLYERAIILGEKV